LLNLTLKLYRLFLRDSNHNRASKFVVPALFSLIDTYPNQLKQKGNSSAISSAIPGFFPISSLIMPF